VISLVYLVTYIDDEMRSGSVKNQEMRKKGDVIYYPRTLDELRKDIEYIISTS